MRSDNSKDFKRLKQLIEQQIEVLRTPLHLTKEIVDHIRSANGGSSVNKKTSLRKLKLEDIPRILEATNNKLRRSVHDYYSKQSLGQLFDQLKTLRETNRKKRVNTVKSLAALQLQFIDLHINNYVLDDLQEKISEMPVINTDENDKDGDDIARYNELTSDLKVKLARLTKLEEETRSIINTNELLNDKLIGDGSFTYNLSKNIPLKSASTSEVNAEVTKLKALLNKLLIDINNDPEKKKLIIQYLRLRQEELDELLLLQ